MNYASDVTEDREGGKHKSVLTTRSRNSLQE